MESGTISLEASLNPSNLKIKRNSNLINSKEAVMAINIILAKFSMHRISNASDINKLISPPQSSPPSQTVAQAQAVAVDSSEHHSKISQV